MISLTSSNTPEPIKLACIILCAGTGSRLASRLGRSTPKQFLKVDEHPLFFYALRTFMQFYEKHQGVFNYQNSSNYDALNINVTIYLVTQADNQKELKKLTELALKQPLPEHIKILATGGQTRQESVLNSLKVLDDSKLIWALVHDSARPYLHIDDLERLVASLSIKNQNPDFKGAILVKKVFDTVKMLRINDSHHELQTLDREQLFFAQTPQLFELNCLIKAMDAAQKEQKIVTDEAQAIELYFQAQQKAYVIEPVISQHPNDKITVLEDWQRLAAIKNA